MPFLGSSAQRRGALQDTSLCAQTFFTYNTTLDMLSEVLLNNQFTVISKYKIDL